MPDLWTPPTSTAAGSYFRIDEPKPGKPKGFSFGVLGMTTASGLEIYSSAGNDTQSILIRRASEGRYGLGSSRLHTVSSLLNEEFEVLTPLVLKIDEEEGEFIACFEEANIAMSGDTEEEAIENVLADILDTFVLFSKEETNLGPKPARQLSVLRRYLQQKP